MGRKINEVETDEIIDTKATDNPDVIDAEIIPQSRLTQSKDLQGKDAIDKGYADRRREERLTRTKETTRPKKEPNQALLTTTEKITGTDSPAGLNQDVVIKLKKQKKDIVETFRSPEKKAYKRNVKILDRVQASDYSEFIKTENDRYFTLQALENGNILAKDKVGKNIRIQKAGTGRSVQGDDLFHGNLDMPSEALENKLTKASVNRLKAGKGTERDYQLLKEDIEELKRLEEYYGVDEGSSMF